MPRQCSPSVRRQIVSRLRSGEPVAAETGVCQATLIDAGVIVWSAMSPDFSEYQFRVIVCEHNHSPMRKMIYELLARNGYRRVYEEFSHVDDWYVLNPIP